MSDHTNMNLHEKWMAAIKDLNEKYIFFVTDILNMGRPHETTATKTADVGIRKGEDGEDEFFFRFNPDFAKNLTVEQFGFVLAHECMHLVLRHPQRLRHIDLSAKGARKKANVAMDVIINDLLAMNGFPGIPGVMRGADVVGKDCAYDSFSRVIKRVPDQDDDEQNGLDDHDWIFDPKYEGEDGDASGAMDSLLDNNLTNAVEDFLSQNGMNSQGDAIGRQAGKGTGSAQSFAEAHGVSVKWVELLREVDPDMFKGKGDAEMPSFRRQPTRLMSVYPKLPLPIYEKDPTRQAANSERPGIVLALDTSGSITDTMRNTFLTLGKSIPKDKVEVYALGFNTQAYRIDLNNPKTHGGGTDFDCIERFIREHYMAENKGRYPKAVVVITDLYAKFQHYLPTPDHIKNWTWLHAVEYGPYDSDAFVRVRRDFTARFGFKNIVNMKDFVKR